MGEIEVPKGTAFVGINSMVKHSVAGTEYKSVRIGAFMGKQIINQIRAQNGRAPIQHLTELEPDSFEKDYREVLPERIRGSDFLAEYISHGDPVTKIQPDAVYRLLGPTLHPVYENQRVLMFMDQLRSAASGEDKAALTAAGECMFASHDSYRENCLLSVAEVDSIVDAVRKRGPQRGLYGAKITGGGSGGTVAVFGSREALDREIPAIAREYKRLTGLDADIFDGTSPGAIEFGSFRYTCGSTGWIRSI
jgi:L-arabinokinase